MLSVNKATGKCDICQGVKNVEIVEFTDEQECGNYHCGEVVDICVSICQDCLGKALELFK